MADEIDDATHDLDMRIHDLVFACLEYFQATRERNNYKITPRRKNILRRSEDLQIAIELNRRRHDGTLPNPPHDLASGEVR